MRLIIVLKNGREIELAKGVTRAQVDEMLTYEDALDKDGRHHLGVGWDAVRHVVELVLAQPKGGS